MFADICPDRQAVVLTVWRQALCGVDAGVGAPWADIDMPHAEDRCISTPANCMAVWVISTNEELMIAQHTQALLQTEITAFGV